MSSIEIERICNAVDESILETSAIGVPPLEGGPEQLVIAVVLKEAETPSSPDVQHRLRMSFNSALQKKLNPLFRVPYLPYSTTLFNSFLLALSIVD